MAELEQKYGKVPAPKGFKSDFIVPVCMLVLFLLGLAFIYSAQSYNMDEIPLERQFWLKQIVFFCAVGAPVYFILGAMDYRVFFTYAHWFYGLSLLLLLPLVLKETFSVYVPFVESRYNATRWLDFGLISVQPSEFAKIGTCIMAAAMFSRNKIGALKENLWFWVKLFLVFFIPILLIFLQPDLGSALVFFPMAFAMLYISALPKRFFAVILATFAVAFALVSFDIYQYSRFLEANDISASAAAKQNAFGSGGGVHLPMMDYQRNRILAFVAPDMVDPRGTEVTWNQRQSLISVGTGGLLGKGVAEGTQAKLGYLPSSVAYNDFIFSVLAEESGFLGGVLAVFLTAVIVIYGCVHTAQLSRDKFGQFLCIGIAAILMTHSFINIGMTIGVMPITGLPLPMLSYGGTFVVTCCILLGLVQSVYRHRRDYM